MGFSVWYSSTMLTHNHNDNFEYYCSLKININKVIITVHNTRGLCLQQYLFSDRSWSKCSIKEPHKNVHIILGFIVIDNVTNPWIFKILQMLARTKISWSVYLYWPCNSTVNKIDILINIDTNFFYSIIMFFCFFIL